MTPRLVMIIPPTGTQCGAALVDWAKERELGRPTEEITKSLKLSTLDDQEIKGRIMLFAAALEAAPKMVKSRCKRAPKAVLKLPDLEQSKSAVLNSLTNIGEFKTPLRPCDSRIHRLVLLGASTRLQQNGSHAVPDCTRRAPLCSVDDQPEIGGDTTAGV